MVARMDSARFFAADAFARHNGMECVEVAPGRAVVKMEVRDYHKNSHGTVHGGALFTLADTAFALASNSHGIPAAAINAQISYLTAATSGPLYAEAEEYAAKLKLASYTVRITTTRRRSPSSRGWSTARRPGAADGRRNHDEQRDLR